MRQTIFLILLGILTVPLPSRAQDAQITNQWEVYSPTFSKQNGQVIMYYGGWDNVQHTIFLNAGTSPHDTIYRSVCSSPTNCTQGQAVLSPTNYDMGLLNDPSIVQINNYLIMYMTGVASTDPNAGYTTSNNKVYYSTSWASDGVNWSQPQLLLTDFWTPSATIGPNNDVLVYGSSNVNGQMYVYDVGPGGNTPRQKQLIHIIDPSSGHELGINYTNINVTYWPQYKYFQMFGQSFDQSKIDYLYGTDGINFYLERPGIVTSANPIVTPSNWPDSYCWLYYGQQVNDSWNIYFRNWCSQ